MCGETVNPSNDKFASSALRCLINANKGLLWKSLAVVPLCFVDRVKKGLALAGAAHISCTGMTSVKIGAVRFFTINALDCFFIKKRFSQQMLESSEFICLVAQNVKAGLATMTDEEVSDLIVEISTKQR